MIQQIAHELGAGEAEAIALARSLHADWLLTDDAEARVVAQLAGLEVHGSLGVLLGLRQPETSVRPRLMLHWSGSSVPRCGFLGILWMRRAEP